MDKVGLDRLPVGAGEVATRPCQPVRKIQQVAPIGKLRVLRGAVFGMATFVFAQVMMMIMGAMMGGLPPMEGSKAMLMMGSIIGHVVFGIVVALLVKPALQPRTN